MGMLSEFKAFAMRGNVVDLAVGVVIGASFGKIVTALVEKIIMPVISVITSSKNFASRSYKPEIPGIDPAFLPEIGWGAFVQATIDFIIVAFALFLVVKAINSMKKTQVAAPTPPPEEVVLLREIRDALKK